MARLLFVSNGHGEAAIAERIARDARAEDPTAALLHLPLVGTGQFGATLEAVGPRRVLPSGGLVAMGNVAAFASDVRAGFLALLSAQLGFLLRAAAVADVAVAVGDAYALLLASVTRLPRVFVGTAKSAYVSPYGRAERWLIKRADVAFVRDAPPPCGNCCTAASPHRRPM